MTEIKDLENCVLLSRYRTATSFNLYERPDEAKLVIELYGSVRDWIREIHDLEREILARMQ